MDTFRKRNIAACFQWELEAPQLAEALLMDSSDFFP